MYINMDLWYSWSGIDLSNTIPNNCPIFIWTISLRCPAFIWVWCLCCPTSIWLSNTVSHIYIKAEQHKRLTQKTAGLHKRLSPNESRTTHTNNPSEIWTTKTTNPYVIWTTQRNNPWHCSKIIYFNRNLHKQNNSNAIKTTNRSVHLAYMCIFLDSFIKTLYYLELYLIDQLYLKAKWKLDNTKVKPIWKLDNAE
jgi:hypothetical protein